MEYITKKELLAQTGLTYSRLYRWKRLGLIPEGWFIKRAASTGQETVLPKSKILKRIADIQEGMKTQTLEQLAEKYKFDKDKAVIEFRQLYKSPYLAPEYVNAVGNYFKKPGYTACEYMMIICAADLAKKEHFTTRQYVDLLRYCLPVAEKCTGVEVRCLFFAAGGDYHLAVYDNTTDVVFDNGLRTMGSYNFETMWEKLKNE